MLEITHSDLVLRSLPLIVLDSLLTAENEQIILVVLILKIYPLFQSCLGIRVYQSPIVVRGPVPRR